MSHSHNTLLGCEVFDWKHRIVYRSQENLSVLQQLVENESIAARSSDFAGHPSEENEEMPEHPWERFLKEIMDIDEHSKATYHKFEELIDAGCMATLKHFVYPTVNTRSPKWPRRRMAWIDERTNAGNPTARENKGALTTLEMYVALNTAVCVTAS